jgi:hypothetical protein
MMNPLPGVDDDMMMSRLCDGFIYGLLAANTCRISYTTVSSGEIIAVIKPINRILLQPRSSFEENIFSMLPIEARRAIFRYINQLLFNMSQRWRDYAWIGVFAVLVTFAIPWFLWGNTITLGGLPVWLWWHIGWMCIAAIVFAAFTRSAWDRGMDVPITRSAAGADVGREDRTDG